jgi:hypothetical protein
MKATWRTFRSFRTSTGSIIDKRQTLSQLPVKALSYYVSVGGLRLPKVLKNTTNMLSSIVCCHRKLRLWDEGVHGMKGSIWKKDESVPKLWMEKLCLSTTTVMENEPT